MTKKIVAIVLVVIICLAAFMVTRYYPEPDDNQTKKSTIDIDDLDNKSKHSNGYLSDLQINTKDIQDLQSVDGFLSLSDSQKKQLSQNGFVVLLDSSEQTDFSAAYMRVHDRDIPIFITTDSIVHTNHIFFDDLLSKLETDHLVGIAENLSIDMMESSLAQYNASTGLTKNCAFNNTAFFAVALKCLMPNYTIPDLVTETVAQERGLIEKHDGFYYSPIFDGRNSTWNGMPPDWSREYLEDYSQYKPRGHYTRSEVLKRYFKAMMWYGRISFLGASDALTRSAILITDAMANDQGTLQRWNTVGDIVKLFVGETDDNEYTDYKPLVDKIFPSFSSDYRELNDDEKLSDFKEELATLPLPRINSNVVRNKVDWINQTCLRFMGQKYIPDSYMFQQMVYGFVGEYLGNKDPFTIAYGGDGLPVKGYPRGLEVFSILGNDRAYEILNESDDTNYKNYTEQFNKMNTEFTTQPEANWTQNLYWSTLDTFRKLNVNFSKDSKNPEFMRTQEWRTQKLNTNLGGWAELRHDTILYAKQSYSGAPDSVPPEYTARGYVEPVPEFYQRCKELIDSLNNELNSKGFLPEKYDNYLDRYSTLLSDLKTISEKELDGKELTSDDYSKIRDIGETLDYITRMIDDDGRKTTIIADVHTNSHPNEMQCVEEAVGYIDYMVVCIKLDGKYKSFVGPVFSYYEFKQPLKNRLSDPDWEELLDSKECPARPDWINTIAE